MRQNSDAFKKNSKNEIQSWKCNFPSQCPLKQQKQSFVDDKMAAFDETVTLQ